jgi:hypothetical protein
MMIGIIKFESAFTRRAEVQRRRIRAIRGQIRGLFRRLFPSRAKTPDFNPNLLSESVFIRVHPWLISSFACRYAGLGPFVVTLRGSKIVIFRNLEKC